MNKKIPCISKKYNIKISKKMLQYFQKNITIISAVLLIEYKKGETEMAEKKSSGKKSEKKTVKNNKSQKVSTVKKVAIAFSLSLVIILAIAAGTYAYIGKVYFKDKFYPGTFINEYDVSEATVDDAYALMDADIQAYKLTITKNGELVDVLAAKDIGFDTTSILANVQKLSDDKNILAWGKYYISPQKVNLSFDKVVKYDENKYNESVNGLNVMTLQPTVVNQNAKVIYSEGQYVIQPEVWGDQINTDIVKTAIKDCVDNMKTTLELKDIDCYYHPEILKDNRTLVDGAAKANNYLNRTISVKVISSSYTLGKETLRSWINVDDMGNMTANEEAIRKYAQTIFNQYTTLAGYGIERKFKTSYGDTVTVSGGDYGRLVNRDDLREEIKNVVLSDDRTLIDVPFSRGAMGSLTNDIGTTYAEIDLTNQRMWMYSNGQVVVKSDIVTGRPTDGHATPQGTYKLKYKQQNATLKGPGYSTKVSWWMPFNADIGMHDAVWQSAFGGTRYKDGYGSHGCVNLPLGKAAEIYKYAVVGMPVICYYHSPA